MRSWRTSGVVNSMIAVAICIAVVAVALPAKQSAPLTVAELAPRAVQTKVEGAESRAQDERREAQDPGGRSTGKDAEKGGDGDGANGDGNGGGGDGAKADGRDDADGDDESDDPDAPQGGDPADTTDDTSGDAPQEAPPRRRRCVGNPPRQTEDPQSPPCVAGSAFDASNNGGATSKGVTADEIRIALPLSAQIRAGLEAHFNTRYEFYGRKLRLLDIGAKTEVDTVDRALADAVRADQDFQVFASAHYGFGGGPHETYYDELARRGVVSVHARAMTEPASTLARAAPYRWSVLPPLDEAASFVGEYVCAGLVGHRPTYGQLAQKTRTDRVFGLVVSLRPDGTAPDLGDLRERLAACGAKPAIEARVPSGADAAAVRQALVKLQTARVTTVVQATNEYGGESQLLPAASAQAYFPEWLLSPVNDPDDSDGLVFDAVQNGSRFGPVWLDKQLPQDRDPAFLALAEGDPGAAASFNGYTYRAFLEYSYHSLLVLASGIQAAGPNLTPQTFAQGLQGSRFPNPGANAPSDYQAAFDFGGPDASAVHDAAIARYTTAARSQESGLPGAVCYVPGGRRYAPGAPPSDDGGIGERC